MTARSFAASPYQRALHAAHRGGTGPFARARLRVTGAVDADAVRAAIATLVARHEALRSRLGDVEGTVAQLLDAAPEVTLDGLQVDLTLPATVIDVASFATLARELADLLAGRRLAEDPVQFAEFADWRNELASTRDAPTAATPAATVDAKDRVLAAWIATLTRRTGRTPEVRVAVDPRDVEPELGALVGRAIAYAPLRITCEVDDTFDALAHAVAAARAGLVAGEVEHVPRSGGVGFDVDPGPVHARAGGVHVELVGVDACPEPLELRLRWAPGSGALTVLTPSGVDARLADAVRASLAAATHAPHTPLAALPSMGAAERAWLDGLATGPRPREASLLTRALLDAARRHPDRLAVADGTCTWSYAELVGRASAIARSLAPRVGRGAIVAVEAEPCAATLAAMLGVLLAGAAYVPLDPGLPRRRVERLLADSGAAAVLAPRALDAIPPVAPPSVGADDLAYVIYTSGSTGQPKGVMVTHGGLASYLTFAAERYGLGHDVTGIVSAPFAFDLSITTLLAPLAAGAGVAIVPPAPEAVVRAFAAIRGDVLLKVTPRHLDALASLLSRADAARVRTVVVGGEPLGAATVARWRALAPHARLINEYGPTETVVGCSVHEVTAAKDPVPIGAPIDGTTLLVLDERGEPAPVGVSGELYIGGVAVARGYLGAPELTASRFVPDPRASGGRMFRTGDRAYVDPDGRLVFVGRLDDQLKVRGYRVEPAEVEAVLAAYPGVAAAAVVRAAQSLVGFVVAPGGPLELAAITRHAAELLPDYMVPTRVVVLERLPLTPNGKVDRAALAAHHALAEPPGGGAPAGSAMEQLVVQVWRDVLGVAHVDLDARFLEMGGDSLSIIAAAARLQELVGRPVPPAWLFEHPTARTLAAALGGEATPRSKELGAERAARRKGRR